MIAGLYDIFAHWHSTGTVWLISDTHFDDEELAAGVSNRPSTEEYIKLISSKVGKRDTVIHLGDVGNLEAMKKIKGYKILIMGNHDSGKSNYLEVFDEVYQGPLIIGEKLILSHEPVDIIGMFNLHGHTHATTHKNDNTHFNCCSDYVGYTPINFNQWMKQGYLSKLQTLHRSTINLATKQKKKRNK